MRTHTLHKQAPLMRMIPTQDKPSHTPVPWYIGNKKRLSGDKGPIFIGSIQDGKTKIICEIGKSSCAENQKNAKLISSAPIMLDALQAVADSMIGSDSLLARQVRVAIVKATQ